VPRDARVYRRTLPLKDFGVNRDLDSDEAVDLAPKWYQRQKQVLQMGQESVRTSH
jgi:hypothetical protein